MEGFIPAAEPSQRRVLVTGAGGFIGHHLVTALKERGFWVRAADVRFPSFAASPADEYRLVDLTDRRGCLDATRDVDDVFALAAGRRDAAADGAETLHNDVLVAANTALAASENSVSRLVVAGAYSDADDDSEAPVEVVRELARRWRSGTRLRLVRLPHVFGELDAWERRSESSIAALCRRFVCAVLNGDATVEAPVDRRGRRRYLYVDECVDALLAAMSTRSRAVEVDVPGEEVSAGEIVDELARLAEVEVPGGSRTRSSGWQQTSSLWDGLSTTYAWTESQVRRELVTPLAPEVDDAETFAYTVVIDDEPGEEGYVVLSEPLRDYVIASDCRSDADDEALMLITHVHAHPGDGRPGVAAGSLLASRR